MICAPFFIAVQLGCLASVGSFNIFGSFPDVCPGSRMTETGRERNVGR